MNISALLKEAAGEVASEEKKEAEEGILAAAEQMDHNIVGILSPKLSASPPRKLLEKDLDVREDIDELLKQMSVKPKYSGNTIDDVDALLQSQKKVASEKSRLSMDLFRRRKSAHEASKLSTKSVTSSRRQNAGSWGSAELSRVSVMLSEADDKSWGRDIRCAFKSPQEELLFRSMKVVRPVSHASTGRVDGTAGRNREKERERVSDRGLNATATARLQKHVPCCDLDLHSTQKSKAQHAEERHRLHESIRLAAERMSSLGGASGGGSNRQPSRQNLRTDPTLAFATFDDAKECTFQPRISGKARKLKKRGEEDEDEKEREKDRFAFINRQEAEERNRRDELQFQMGKADYDAKVDKKTCPRCGAKQSFDEFKEKRKNCVHCNVEYCAAVSWGKVGRRFFQSSLEFSQKVAEKKARLRREAEAEFMCVARTEVDPRTGRTSTRLAERKQVLTPEEELEFFDRMEAQLRRREEKLGALEAKIQREQFPFQPSIASRSHKSSKGGDSSNSEEESDDDEEEGEGGSRAVKAFLRRYKQDLEARKDKFPAKYIRSKSRPEEDLQPFRISKAIDRGGEMYL